MIRDLKGNYFRVALLTSTDDNDTLLIDNYQLTNPDPEKQNKEQYIRPLNTFILIGQNEHLTIDVETTLFFHNKNSNNDSILDLIVSALKERENIWSKNNYQLPYTADENFLRNIALIFAEKQLKTLEEDLQKLQQLSETNPDLFAEKILELDQLKVKQKNEKEAQLYFSLLPPLFQKLKKALDLFKAKKQKDEKKQQIAERIKESKEDKSKLVEKEKTAKQKREDYLKIKNTKNND